MDNKHIIDRKSKSFALKIIKLCKSLNGDMVDSVLARQLIRSGTSIGANVKERLNAQSRADFIYKLQVALKEADESAYWLELLHESTIISDEVFSPIYSELKEIVAIITASLNKLKNTSDSAL